MSRSTRTVSTAGESHLTSVGAMAYREFFSHVVDVVEGVGAAILVFGGLGAFIRFGYELTARRGREAYDDLRRNLGRVILLGLEVLIIADIIRTIVVDQSVESVTVLGIIVLDPRRVELLARGRDRRHVAVEQVACQARRGGVLAPAPRRIGEDGADGREADVASLDDFERYPLTFGPSPIHPLPRLSAHLGGAVEIWAKREDCNSGIAFGGNKTRKLEYLIPDALAQGCDTLVSIGGVQSNHTRQVTGVAAHLGLKAVTVQEAWVDWPDVVYDKVGNIQLSRIMGGDVRMDPAGFDIGIRDSWQRALDSVVEAGRQAVPDPGRCLRPSPGRARVRQLGPRGRSAGGRARPLLRPHHRVHGHRLHPGRHDRRLRAREPLATATSSASTPQPRCNKTIEQVSRIARDTAARIGLDRDLRCRRDHHRRRLLGGDLRDPRRADHRRHPHLRPRSRGCSPTRSTRASRWPG